MREKVGFLLLGPEIRGILVRAICRDLPSPRRWAIFGGRGSTGDNVKSNELAGGILKVQDFLHYGEKQIWTFGGFGDRAGGDWGITGSVCAPLIKYLGGSLRAIESHKPSSECQNV